jgi:hypothetical protein
MANQFADLKFVVTNTHSFSQRADCRHAKLGETGHFIFGG